MSTRGKAKAKAKAKTGTPQKVKCVSYTGIGANPSGLHTPNAFLATTRTTRTQMMCAEAEANKGRHTVKGKSTIDGNTYVFSVPKCPKKYDVKGWIQWTGASVCNKAQEKALKNRTNYE